MVLHYRSGVIFVLLISSFGFVGCSGLVSGNNGNTPPTTLAITNLQAASITTSSSQVVWTTNVPANSSVDYGTTTAYGNSTPVDSAMVTSHQMTLSGLAAGTTYYYQVNSTDSKGYNGHSGNKFKTGGFTLSGTINPSAAGSGATVALSGPASAATTADSAGNYTFAALPNGSYLVTPTHAGYAFTPGNQSATVNGANVTGVNFTANATPVAPSITTQPASQTVTAGQTASFSVAATGTAPLTYQWNKNGAAISGATSSSYTTPAATTSDNAAQFTVAVSNTAGSVTSSAATLTVNAAPVVPSITTQPASQTVTAGQTASFSVAATGTAPLSYQWNKNGTAISGATSSAYTTPPTTSSDNGAAFTVVVSNTAGSATSNPAALTVNAATVAPSITAQPTSQTVTAGQAASFSVAATGTAPLSYQWQKNGANIAGATSSTYTTPATTTSDSGSTFRVAITNPAGTVTSSAATLTVNAAPVAPSITTQPTNQTVTAGQTASFSVAASGNAPLSYQWQKNSVAIGGATSSTYTTPATTSSDNGAQFTVAVTNTAGSVTSTPATLTVNAAPVPPSITTQPTSQTVTAGQAASFSVAATGAAPLSYQWNKNGAAISGATSSSYTTPATTTSDSAAQFMVLVSNSAGSVTSSIATLTVNAAPVPPSITAQPTSQTVTAGQTATFNVAATGTAPLSYQWRKNNVAISGATSSTYTTLATTTSDSGSTFAVVVSNSAGTVTSAAATLTVNNGGNTIYEAESSANTLTGIAKVSACASCSGGKDVGFIGTGTGGSGTLQFNNVAAATAGNYAVTISYLNGDAAARTALVSVNGGAATTVTFAPSGSWTTVASQSVNMAFNSGNNTILISNPTSWAPDIDDIIVPPGVAPPDTTPPTVAITSPVNNATVSGNLTISGTAADNVAVSSVAISVDGGAYAAASGTSNWTFSLNTTSLTQASHTISAKATDTSGNVSTVASISVTVNNSTPPPAITSALTASATAGTAFSYQITASNSPTSFGASPLPAGLVVNTSNGLISGTPTAAGSVSLTISATSASGTGTATLSLIINSASAFPVWVSPSLVRVGQADVPGTTSTINLSGARGETVDTQVVVQAPTSGLTNVNLSGSSLTGPGGVTIPASNVTLYREHYLSVTGTASYGGGSNPPQGSGTYAEPLIPFNDPETGSSLCGTSAVLKACNATISAGQNQPYWIDISVPHGATNSPPGIYTGTISITTAQGNATVPVTLTVWNFELPVQPSELSLWTGFSPNSGNTVTTLAQALMRNKVMGWYDAAANASSDMTSFGLNRSGLDNYYFIGIQCNGSYSSIPSTSQINAAAANFPAGLGLDFYIADELNGCTADYTSVKTMAANAHAANRSVKTVFTLNTPDSNLYGAIDHWVLLDSLQQWPALPFAAGGDLWSYTSCNTGFGNTPEWLVDYPPINERIQAGFLNWTQGATGLLYYRADGWTNGNTIGSWNNVDTTACGGGLGRPGDGIFLYPPGPIASTESAPGIRLKAIRDGIQDYEYAQILKNLGQVTSLNSIVQPIATSWSNWTHDPNALESARQQLGQLLHQLAP